LLENVKEVLAILTLGDSVLGNQTSIEYLGQLLQGIISNIEVAIIVVSFWNGSLFMLIFLFFSFFLKVNVTKF
jgi:hypothetical protein